MNDDNTLFDCRCSYLLLSTIELCVLVPDCFKRIISIKYPQKIKIISIPFLLQVLSQSITFNAIIHL